MVKKLFKHEFSALGRVLFPAFGILIAVGIFTRLLQLVEFDSPLYDSAYESTMTVFTLSCVAIAIMTWAMCIIRYYRHLFTTEGYLSFTLPITPAQHIGVKLITAIAFEVMALVTILLAVVIALDLDLLIELAKAAVYYIKDILLKINWQFYLYALEILLLMFGVTVYNMLIYYTCITLGQLSKKNRIGYAVGIYFLYYVAGRILMTVGMAMIALFGEAFWDMVSDFVTAHPYGSVHMIFCGCLAIVAGACVALFLICRYILKHRLNLE